jgi:hypothetical protein
MTHLELIYSYYLSTLADAIYQTSIYRLNYTVTWTEILWRNGRFLFGSTYLAASRRHVDRLNSMVIRTEMLVRNVRFLLDSI